MAKILRIYFICCLFFASVSHAGVLDGTYCVAPAKPEGGFDVTCKLLNEALLKGKETKKPLNIQYQPGGVGALAFNTTVRQHANDKSRLVAFSSGTLLNLAQNRFGENGVDDVRWLAVVGVDYGVVVVHKDAPYKNLSSLIQAIKANPEQIAFGSSGTIGSQDWFKATLISREADVNHKRVKVVAFEGGGDALNALQGGHIQVLAGDTGEVTKLLSSGKVRVLAVMSDARLPGVWASVPTAREQGYNLSWSSLRGVYVGLSVSAKDALDLEEAIKRSVTKKSYDDYLRAYGFEYKLITGEDLQVLVRKTVDDYKKILREYKFL
jgi:putative tricarboxylic transport membrane protein